MRFAVRDSDVCAERVSDGQQFVLKHWQHQLMLRLDGKQTFEEAARGVYRQFPKDFSAVGLVNFYEWLCDENLVLRECESIFELAPEEESEAMTPERTTPLTRNPHFSDETQRSVQKSFRVSKDWQKKALRIAAIILLSLAVLRIAYVSAPILETPVNYVYSSIEGWLYEGVTPPTQREVTAEMPETPDEVLEMAGQVAPPLPVAMSEPDPVMAHDAIPDPAPLTAPPPTVADLEALRREMAECRIRRDEFYLQNNEIGCRYEVQRMTTLAKKIGEIEAHLD